MEIFFAARFVVLEKLVFCPWWYTVLMDGVHQTTAARDIKWIMTVELFARHTSNSYYYYYYFIQPPQSYPQLEYKSHRIPVLDLHAFVSNNLLPHTSIHPTICVLLDSTHCAY